MGKYFFVNAQGKLFFHIIGRGLGNILLMGKMNDKFHIIYLILENRIINNTFK